MDGAGCPVCRAVAATTLGSKGGFEYRRCADCGLVYAPELPTPEQYQAAYAHYAARPPSAGKVLRKRLALAPLLWLARARTPQRPLRFLDVGAHTGFTTEAARQQGCEAHGLETNPKTVAFARQWFPRCTFHAEPIEALTARGLGFDFIYSNQVIEHVPDPHAFVAALAALAAPRATLYITTPDADHWRTPKRIVDWKYTIPVEHLRLYGKRSLTRLLEAHGLRVLFTLPTTRTNLRAVAVRNGH